MSAFEKFNSLRVGALFMEQGTGKTRVAIELIHSTDANYAFFLCPFSTKENLEKEIRKWHLSIPYQIVGYETISASDRIYLKLLDELKDKKLFIVADESIFIKNEETKRFNRVMRFAELSDYRLILNGTPITKNEWDLYNQMEFLSPKIIGMSRNQFLNTFFTKVQYKKKFERPKEFYKLSQVNVGYLHKLIEPYIFRVSINFKNKIEEKEVLVNASEETKKEYKKLKKRLLEQIIEESDFLDTLVFMQYKAFTDKKRCQEIARQLKGQVIVYCSFLEEVKELASHLDCYVITGDTNPKERANILERFENDSKPLLLTYGVGSYGLNLQFCNRIAFASITFSYGKMDQAKARIKRMGQEKDIEYTYFTSDLGIYELIELNILNKENLSKIMVDKIKEVI